MPPARNSNATTTNGDCPPCHCPPEPAPPPKATAASYTYHDFARARSTFPDKWACVGDFCELSTVGANYLSECPCAAGDEPGWKCEDTAGCVYGPCVGLPPGGDGPTGCYRDETYGITESAHDACAATCNVGYACNTEYACEQAFGGSYGDDADCGGECKPPAQRATCSGPPDYNCDFTGADGNYGEEPPLNAVDVCRLDCKAPPQPAYNCAQ